MSYETNEVIWQRLFKLPLNTKSFNSKFNCQEYSSRCPKCGGADRLSVFSGNNPLMAICWGEESGRNGCGKRFYRRDYADAEEGLIKKALQPGQESLQVILSFIERAHKNIAHKDHVATLIYAKQRGFTEKDIENFKVGSTFKHGKGFALVLPVFEPQPYYQIRWLKWESASDYGKYQNPTGIKPSHALFSTGADTCLVFESLIDAMLVHTKTGCSTFAAMGARLKDRVLTQYKETYLVPDQDNAGKKHFGLQGKYPVLSLPDGYKDMGELILKHGSEIAKHFIEKLIESKRAEQKELKIKPKLQETPTASAPIEETKPVEIYSKEEAETAKEECRTETEEIKEPTYNYITSKNEAIKALEAFSNTTEAIALDTETTGLNFRTDKIRLVQLFAPSVGCYLFDLFAIDDCTFLKPLESKHFIIHYAPFDVKFLSANGIKLTNYEDTKMMAALTYPIPSPKSEKRQNLEKVSSKYIQRNMTLKGLLYTHLGVEVEKEANIRTGWEGDLSEEKLEYAAKDVLYLHKLYSSLKYKIDNYGFKDIYPYYVEGLKAHIAMEEVGAPIRKAALTKVIQELDPLDRCIDFIEKYGIDNPNSNKQLSGYVSDNFPDISLPKTPKGEQVKLGKESLEELNHPDPFFKNLQDYRKQVTAHKEHLKLYEATCNATDRVFTSFNILGASSGRTITRDPNLQGQANSVKPFIGFSGKGSSRITAADYSQQELRIFSLLTQNEAFLKLLSTGEDGYKGVAAVVLSKNTEEITKEERKLFKAVTLALLYGKGIKAFAKNIQMNEGVAKKIYIKVKNTLFVDKLKDRLSKEHKRNGHVLTVFGSMQRPIKDIWRTLKEYQLINYCIQGTASNIGLLALSKIYAVLPSEVKVIGYIHDEFLLEHDSSNTQEVHDITRQCMIEAFIECFPQAEDQRKHLVEINTDRRWLK